MPRSLHVPAHALLVLLTVVALIASITPADANLTASDPALPALPARDDSGYQKKLPRLMTPWYDEVGPDNALPEYPRPQMTRPEWQNLNGVWEFAAAEPTDLPPFGTELAERILVPYPVESALSGIMRHEDRMWYRRTFTVPEAWGVGGAGGERLQLHFGAIDYLSAVWVNGERVATHVGGYDGFSVDITDHLIDGDNELIVGVADTTDRPSPVQGLHAAAAGGDGMAAILDLGGTGFQPVGKQRWLRGGIYYSEHSGIWQTVWMEPTPAAHVARVDTTPDVAGEALAVTVRTVGTAAAHTVEAVAYDDGVEVGRVTGAPNTELRLPVPDARLWSPDDPHLYDLRVRLLDGADAIDEVDAYFGMRSVELCRVDDVTRICLNGEVLTQLGPLDQGYWPDGISTAPTDAALRYDLELTRALGFNMTRKHIKVEPDRWYYHADQIGLLVWQDMPSMQALTRNYPPVAAQLEFERQLEVMVDTHRSWTSIIAWVPFNEGWGEWSLEGTARIAEEVKAMDPSRLVDANSGAPCCHSWGDSGAGDIYDDHTYPGPGSPALWADRASVNGEYGGYGLVVPGHQWGGSFAWAMTDSREALTGCIVGAQQRMAREVERGVSAGVYTQITDVEDEVNGFATYDRQVVKVDVDRVAAVNRAIIDGQPVTGTGAGPGADTGIDAAAGTWAFDEGSGTAARDSSGHGNDGTLQPGAGWTPAGHRGSAVSFNGSGFVDMGTTILDTSGDFTVSAWVRMNAPGSSFETFVSEDGQDASAFFLQYSGQDQRFAFSTMAGRALAPEAPEPNRWYHLVGVKSADGMALYVDGELAGQLDTCMPQRATGPFVVGRGRANGAQVDHVNGAIDEVRVWDRALTAADVAALHEATR